MGAISSLFSNTGRIVSFLKEALGYLIALIRALFLPRARLTARLLAAESQLAVCKLRIQQQKDPRPRFSQAFRMLWVVLSKVWKGWEKHAHLRQPATVKKWHTTAFRLYRRWKSRRKPGRPPISKEMQALIGRLSTDNPLWSAERIRDTLRLLGIDPA